MATRFRLTADGTNPDVSPALQSYTHTNTNRRKLLTSDTSALTTTAVTPDGSDHLVAGDAHHMQFTSDPMVSGITFTNGNTIKYAVQCLEAHAGNNLQVQLFVSIVNQAGDTVQRVLRSKVLEGTELATSLTNRFHSTTQDGATYTTATGDRLVVEFSVSGTPTGAGGVQGHNASMRWGGNGAGGDLLENDTETGTTFNPWIEFAPNITFITNVTVTLDPIVANVSVPSHAVTTAQVILPAALTTDVNLVAPEASVEGGDVTVNAPAMSATAAVIAPDASSGVVAELPALVGQGDLTSATVGIDSVAGLPSVQAQVTMASPQVSAGGAMVKYIFLLPSTRR